MDIAVKTESHIGVAVPKSANGYRRFHINAVETPPRKTQPHPFYPRVSRFGLAKALLKELLHYNVRLLQKKYRAAMMSRPCIYGVFSGPVGGFMPIREKCTGCMRCVQQYPEFCRVDRNPEFFKTADSYWVPSDPKTSATTNAAIVWHEAQTGKILVKGMGYKGGFGGRGWDGMWTDMSEIVRPTRDGVYGREYISTAVDIGRKPGYLKAAAAGGFQEQSRVITTEIPIVFDHIPDTLNCESVVASVARACSAIPAYFIAKPDQVGGLSDTLKERWIPLVGSHDFSRYDFYLRRAPAIELAETNPSLIEAVRKINPRAPLAMRLPLTKGAAELCIELASMGIDIIHLSGNYHGQGRHPDDAVFCGDIFKHVHQALVKAGVRDQVTLIGSGGVTLVEHVPKAIICGVDCVAIDTTVLVALQMDFQGECVSEIEGRIRPEVFGADWGCQRLVNLMASWHYQIIEIMSAMGMRDIRRLRGDVGRAIFQEEMEKQFFAELTSRA